MGEQVQHPYKCMNKGCSNGFESTFYAAPPEWFSSKGINTPKNCPDCKEWKNAQTDSAYRCQTCRSIIRKTANAKIMHHKRQGPYQAPTKCTRCLLGQKAVQAMPKLKREQKPGQFAERVLKLLAGQGFGAPTPREFITDTRAYVGIPQHNDTLQTRQEHIEVHAPWLPPVGGKTKTTYGMPAANLGALLDDAAKLALEGNPTRAVEKVEKGRPVKVSLETGDKIVLRPEDEGPPPVYTLVSAFRLRNLDS